MRPCASTEAEHLFAVNDQNARLFNERFQCLDESLHLLISLHGSRWSAGSTFPSLNRQEIVLPAKWFIAEPR
jgi:hypothetical protein